MSFSFLQQKVLRFPEYPVKGGNNFLFFFRRAKVQVAEKTKNKNGAGKRSARSDERLPNRYHSVTLGISSHLSADSGLLRDPISLNEGSAKKKQAGCPATK